MAGTSACSRVFPKRKAQKELNQIMLLKLTQHRHTSAVANKMPSIADCYL